MDTEQGAAGRYAAVGTSARENSFDAGWHVAREAVDRLADPPGVLFVFAAMSYDHRALLWGIEEAVPGVPMVGGTTAGEIAFGGVSESSVVVLAIASGALEFATGIGQDVSRDEKAAVQQMLQGIFRHMDRSRCSSLMIFPNGMGGAA